MYAKTLQSTVTIRFQDCDPFGHLNNARYIDYFINARGDHLADNYDFHIMEYGKPMAQSWVVSKSQIAYLAPAALAEPVVIQTRLIKATSRQLLVEGLMLDQTEAHLKAICWIEFTYIDLKTGKPTTHDDELNAFLQSVQYDYPDQTYHFDNRVQELKTYYRKVRHSDPLPA